MLQSRRGFCDRSRKSADGDVHQRCALLHPQNKPIAAGIALAGRADPALIRQREGADERLARAYQQIKHADEGLARVSEQVAKMERDDARPPPAEPSPQSPPRKPAFRPLIGLLLAACIVVATLVLQSSYGAGAKLVVARWAPQLR